MADVVETATGILPAGGSLKASTLGVGAITFFVISAAAPLAATAGVFPVAMLLGNGVGIPAALGVAVVLLLCFSAGYTAMARHVTNAGGFYAFTTRGLGGVVGGAAGMIAILAYNTTQIGVYGISGVATAALFKDYLGIDLRWWVYVYAAMIFVAVCGYRQVDLSVRLLSIAVVAEYFGILFLDVSILATGGSNGINFSSFTPGAFFSGSATIGLLICFTAFTGFEATTIYGEEAHNPERTIPLATYIAVLVIGGFYALTTWCMVLGAGTSELVTKLAALSDPTIFVFTLSDQFVGSWLTLVLRILFVISCLAGQLAFHNASARYFFALGREGLLPLSLGRTHDVHRSPHIGSVLQTVIAAIVVTIFVVTNRDPILELFSWLANVGTLAILALISISSFAVFAYFTTNPQLGGKLMQTKILPLVAGAAFMIVAAFAVLHFDVLTGASTTLSATLPLTIVVAGVSGALRALWLRQQNPSRFANLGRNRAQ